MRYACTDAIVVFARESTASQAELDALVQEMALLRARTSRYALPLYALGVVRVFYWLGGDPPNYEELAACTDHPETAARQEPDGLTRAQRIRRGLTALLSSPSDAEIESVLGPTFERVMLDPQPALTLAQRMRADDPAGCDGLDDEAVETMLLTRYPVLFAGIPLTLRAGATPSHRLATCPRCGGAMARHQPRCADCVTRLVARWVADVHAPHWVRV